ncbi:MAG: flagellar export protein FliJ [Gammaproteobacteria bacterium]|nr:flagellar export protein FliJ [Gammaproteobacteria bacterium]
MYKSKRLKPIEQLAEEKELAAAKNLGASLNLVAERKKKLEELDFYRTEYSQRFQSTNNAPTLAYQFHDFRNFLHRLDLVIEEQKKLLLFSEQDVIEKKKIWKACRSKAKALGKVVSRLEVVELMQETRQEQKELDERSLRRQHHR